MSRNKLPNPSESNKRKQIVNNKKVYKLKIS